MRSRELKAVDHVLDDSPDGEILLAWFGILLIGRQKPEVIVLAVEPFNGKLPSYHSNDNITIVGLEASLYDQEIARMNPCIEHRFTFHAN